MMISCLRLCRYHPHLLLIGSNSRHVPSTFAAFRSFSSEKEDLIPEPTWSLKDLQLSSKKEPVSMQELERLARKSLLDVTKFEDPDALRRDLANMLHCLEQVRDTKLPATMSDADVYDVPRGVTAAPLRSSSDDYYTKEEAEEAKQVWESLLKPKTKQHGAHSYFSVIVAKQDVGHKTSRSAEKKQ